MASKPKGPSAQQKRNEKLQEQLMLKQLAASQQAIELPDMTPPPPAPPAPPPPQGTSADVEQAARDQRRRASVRTNAGRGTLFAGETGGYKPQTGGNTTLLG